MNKIIDNEKFINDEILWNYLKYQNPLFVATDSVRAKQAKNEKLVNNINDGLIHFRNAMIRKTISGNQNSNKIVVLLKKSSTLINNKKVKELKY